jgi:hypothetical protein
MTINEKIYFVPPGNAPGQRFIHVKDNGSRLHFTFLLPFNTDTLFRSNTTPCWDSIMLLPAMAD